MGETELLRGTNNSICQKIDLCLIYPCCLTIVRSLNEGQCLVSLVVLSDSGDGSVRVECGAVSHDVVGVAPSSLRTTLILY